MAQGASLHRITRTNYYGLLVKDLPPDMLPVVDDDTGKFEKTVALAMWLHVAIGWSALVVAVLWRLL